MKMYILLLLSLLICVASASAYKYCYQPMANMTDQCGAVGTGACVEGNESGSQSIYWHGVWWLACDGDWNTNADYGGGGNPYPNGTNDIYLIKPSNATGMIWSKKGASYIVNTTLPDDCFNYSATTIWLKEKATQGGDRFYCMMTESSYHLLDSTGAGDHSIFDNGFTWIQPCDPDIQCTGYTECADNVQNCTGITDLNGCDDPLPGNVTAYNLACNLGYQPEFKAEDIPAAALDLGTSGMISAKGLIPVFIVAGVIILLLGAGAYAMSGGLR